MLIKAVWRILSWINQEFHGMSCHKGLKPSSSVDKKMTSRRMKKKDFTSSKAGGYCGCKSFLSITLPYNIGTTCRVLSWDYFNTLWPFYRQVPLRKFQKSVRLVFFFPLILDCHKKSMAKQQETIAPWKVGPRAQLKTCTSLKANISRKNWWFLKDDEMSFL